MKLDLHDLKWALTRLPENIKKVMQLPEWHNNIFIGGGFIRAIVANEKVNDIDLFVKSTKDAELLAFKLCENKKDVIKTDNAYTVKGRSAIQIIHRWVFDKPEDVSNSFDFTICCAVIFYKSFTPEKIEGESKDPKLVKTWDSFCDDRFYVDLAARRLVYRSPIRNEDAGGSMLRVLKYYQRGYRIPLDSLGAVISRLIGSINFHTATTELEVGKVITGLLREVDPNIDPFHDAHLPSMNIEA